MAAGGGLGVACFSWESSGTFPPGTSRLKNHCMHAKPGLAGCEAATPLHACQGLELHSRETARRREQQSTTEALNNAQQQPTC